VQLGHVLCPGEGLLNIPPQTLHARTARILASLSSRLRYLSIPCSPLKNAKAL